jgi:putative heme-binding domain-containing protein
MKPRSRQAQPKLAELLHDDDPFVQRRAAEALLRLGIHPSTEVAFSAEDDVMPLLASEDRFVRYAGRALLREINRNDWQEAALAADGFPQAPEALLAYVQSMHSPYMKDLDRIVARELELLRMNPSDEELLPLLRTIQRTMLEDHGVVFGARGFFGPQGGDAPAEGYEGIGEELLARFPTDDWRVNREIARILAYLESEGAAAEIVAELHNPQNDRQQQIAYADALSFLENGWDEGSMNQMASWFETVYSEEWRGGRQFMSYINLMQNGFLENVPEADRPLLAERIEASKPQREALSGFLGRLNLSPVSQQELEEELVYNPENFEGDFEAGAWAYEKALCMTCHTFGPIGNEVGPDLTTVNQRFNREDLVAAILRPSETISDLWQMETITRTNGEVVSGTVFNETAQEVVVQIPAGPQVTVPKSDIDSRVRSDVSPMPEGLLNLLNGNEQRALLLFLEAGPEAIPDSALTRINGS